MIALRDWGKNNVDHVAFGLCNVWWFHWTDCENVTRWKPTPLKQSQENKAKWTVLVAWIRNDKARVRLVNSPTDEMHWKGKPILCWNCFGITPNQAKKKTCWTQRDTSLHRTRYKRLKMKWPQRPRSKPSLLQIQSFMKAKDMSHDRCEIQLCVRSVPFIK